MKPGLSRKLLRLFVLMVSGCLLSTEAGVYGSVRIPLIRAGKLLLIEAEIDGTVGNFVLDTGADKLVLNLTYFRNNLQPGDQGGGIAGGSGNIYQTHIGNLRASGLSWENLTADVAELGQIENRRKVKILGLFGVSLFRGMEVEIDTRNNLLTLTRLDKKGIPLEMPVEGKTCHFRGKLTSHPQVLLLTGGLGGKPVVFCLDTGAESNVVSSTSPKKVMDAITINRRSQLTGVGGKDTEVLFGVMNDFTLGDLKLNPMQTIVASLTSLSQAYDYPVGGILGFDFFDQGVININLVTKEIRITLNEREQQ